MAPQKISKPKEEKIKVIQSYLFCGKKAFNTVSDKLQVEAQNPERALIVAIEDVSKILRQDEPQKLIEKVALDFPILESLEAQMALIDIVQKSGHSQIIEKIICKDIETGKVSTNIGLKAFAAALHDESLPIEDVGEVVSSIDLSLDKAQQTWDSLETKLGDIKSEKVIPIACSCLVLSTSYIQFKLRKPKSIKPKSHLKPEIGPNLQRNM